MKGQSQRFSTQSALTHRALTRAIRLALNDTVFCHRLSSGSLFLALLAATQANATTYTVTNLNDSGTGSLRNAVELANSHAGPDQIVFAPSITGQITLSSGTLNITDSLNITGPGAESLRLDGNGNTVIQVNSYGVANSPSNLDVTISSLTLKNGNSGISGQTWPYSDQHLELTLSDTVITGNATNGIHFYEGFSAASSYLNVKDCQVNDNGRIGVRISGGGYRSSARGAVSIAGSRIYDNGEIGIDASLSNVSIVDTEINDNGMGLSARGYWDYAGSTVELTDSVVSGNANQGIRIYSSRVTTLRSSVVENAGTGVDVVSFSNVDLLSSTVANNGNGGLSLTGYEASLNVSNSTVSGNLSQSGITVDGYVRLTVAHSTIAQNSGAGIWVTDDYSRNLIMNSIIAGNSPTGDLGGASTFNVGYSLVQHPAGVTLNDYGKNLFDVDPLLETLADNGGPTLTHALSANSPAIDRGDPLVDLDPRFDQRGSPFYRLVNGRVDIGAVENQAGSAWRNTWLLPAGDLDNNGRQNLVLVSDEGAERIARVYDAWNGVLLSQFALGVGANVADVRLIEPVGTASGVTLATLDGDTRKVEMRELPGGELVHTLWFSKGLQVKEMVDINNGTQLAALDASKAKVEIRDIATGKFVRNLWWPKTGNSSALAALTDNNGNGFDDIGLMLMYSVYPDRYVIKDSATNEWQLDFQPWVAGDIWGFQTVEDRNGDGADELLIWASSDGGQLRTEVDVYDPTTGWRLSSASWWSNAWFPSGSAPQPLRRFSMADLTGDGIGEFVEFGANHLQPALSALVRDGATGDIVRTIWFNERCTPLDLVPIDDVNGNGSADLAMLALCGQGGQPTVVIKDAGNGRVINRIER